jgi:hypothetical protein
MLSNNKNNMDDIIKTLIRQTARWTAASIQDSNAFISMLHANYAVGYYQALMDITTPDNVQRVSGVDMDKLKKRIIFAQDRAAQILIQKCPGYKPRDEWLSKIAMEY